MKERAIIVDIDGTVARHPNRGHHEYSKVFEDEPVPAIIDLAVLLDGQVDCTLFVSGRPDSCRADTALWITRHIPELDIDNEFAFLFMRATGDYRSDDIIKREIYEKNIKDRYDVLYVLDDRNRVVKMWRELGLTVLQVADGDF
jgi:hypothetical protein